MMSDSDEIKKTPVYHCPVFDVYEDDVQLPDGRNFKQVMIDHKTTVAVMPIDAEGRLILIRQYRNAVKQHLLEIPAGRMNKGEPAEDCVQRELSEETGFEAGRIAKLFEGYLVPGYCNEYMYFYIAFDLSERYLPPDEDEMIVEKIHVPLAEAIRMIKSGAIIDAKTALGILLAKDYLATNAVQSS
jgi:ADP-ribose pyrophosphatase